LNVNHNNLTEVPSCVLEIQELCTLLMKSNSIKFVSDDTILGLAKLTKFDLRDNTLNEKPDHWKVINIVIQCIY